MGSTDRNTTANVSRVLASPSFRSSLPVLVTLLLAVIIVLLTLAALNSTYESHIEKTAGILEHEHHNIQNILNTAVVYLDLMEQGITHTARYHTGESHEELDDRMLRYSSFYAGMGPDSPEIKEELIAALEIIPVVQVLQRDEQSIIRYSYFSPNGFIVSYPEAAASDLPSPDTYGKIIGNLADASVFRLGEDKGITMPYMSAQSRIPVVSFTQPVTIASSPEQGMLAIDVTLASLQEIISALTEGQQVETVLVSEEGEVACTAGNLLGEELPTLLEDITQELSDAGPGNSVIRHGAYTIMVSRLDAIPWDLVAIERTRTVFFEPLTSYRFFLLILAMLVTAGVIYLFMRRSYREVEELAAEMEVSFDQSPLFLANLDREGRILTINARLLYFLRATSEQAVGRRLDELARMQHVEGLKTFFSQSIDKVRQGETVREILSGTIPEDGTVLHVDVRLSPVLRKDGSLLLMSLAAQDVTENWELHAALERESRQDHLTGLLNRRSFEEHLEREMSRSGRYSIPLSFILMDIDKFKLINDNFGHDYGDIVLVKIAELISRNIRKADIASRWGGEEFIILMPETDQAAAAMTAEKLRVLTEQTVFPNDVHITLSFGVAQWMQVEEPRTWFKRADHALYRAKQSGRNRVEECRWCKMIPVGTTGLDWNPVYETGSPIVDGEHRELLEIASRLLKDIDDHAHMVRARDELKSHIITHFAHEEELMDETGYPGKGKHAAIHQHLIERALQTFEEVDKGFFDNFHLFLIDEIVLEHFFIADKPFVDFMQQEGTRTD